MSLGKKFILACIVASLALGNPMTGNSIAEVSAAVPQQQFNVESNMENIVDDDERELAAATKKPTKTPTPKPTKKPKTAKPTKEKTAKPTKTSKPTTTSTPKPTIAQTEKPTKKPKTAKPTTAST